MKFALLVCLTLLACSEPEQAAAVETTKSTDSAKQSKLEEVSNRLALLENQLLEVEKKLSPRVKVPSSEPEWKTLDYSAVDDFYIKVIKTLLEEEVETLPGKWLRAVYPTAQSQDELIQYIKRNPSTIIVDAIEEVIENGFRPRAHWPADVASKWAEWAPTVPVELWINWLKKEVFAELSGSYKVPRVPLPDLSGSGRLWKDEPSYYRLSDAAVHYFIDEVLNKGR